MRALHASRAEPLQVLLLGGRVGKRGAEGALWCRRPLADAPRRSGHCPVPTRVRTGECAQGPRSPSGYTSRGLAGSSGASIRAANAGSNHAGCAGGSGAPAAPVARRARASQSRGGVTGRKSLGLPEGKSGGWRARDGTGAAHRSIHDPKSPTSLLRASSSSAHTEQPPSRLRRLTGGRGRRGRAKSNGGGGVVGYGAP